MLMRYLMSISGGAFVAVVVAGCAGGPGAGPDGVGLASGAGCKSLKSEIRKYEARGIHYKSDAANRGARLSAKQRADVKRYNSLLNSYL
ncbi:MAG: hypothetical protein AAF346_18285, partial [Pseudomonadota bacterium]